MSSWQHTDIIIAPSLLASDFSRIKEETQRAISSGGDWIHLDVMDGHFVDNISFGPAIIKAIDDVNDAFLDAGSDMITVHVEADHDVSTTLKRIKDAGRQAGLALNPATPMSEVEPYLDQIDLLLCMTVVPGFGGQSFMQEVMPKVEQAVTWRSERGLAYHIQVDGGIDQQTAPSATSAGANVLVAGSSTFKAPDMAAAIQAIRSA